MGLQTFTKPGEVGPDPGSVVRVVTPGVVLVIEPLRQCHAGLNDHAGTVQVVAISQCWESGPAEVRIRHHGPRQSGSGPGRASDPEPEARNVL